MNNRSRMEVARTTSGGNAKIRRMRNRHFPAQAHCLCANARQIFRPLGDIDFALERHIEFARLSGEMLEMDEHLQRLDGELETNIRLAEQRTRCAMLNQQIGDQLAVHKSLLERIAYVLNRGLKWACSFRKPHQV